VRLFSLPACFVFGFTDRVGEAYNGGCRPEGNKTCAVKNVRGGDIFGIESWFRLLATVLRGKMWLPLNASILVANGTEVFGQSYQGQRKYVRRS
jgi:hypothetical protein